MNIRFIYKFLMRSNPSFDTISGKSAQDDRVEVVGRLESSNTVRGEALLNNVEGLVQSIRTAQKNIFFFFSFFFLIFFSNINCNQNKSLVLPSPSKLYAKTGSLSKDSNGSFFLIDKISLSQSTLWHLTSQQGFLLTDPSRPDCKAYMRSAEVNVAVINKTLFINGKKFSRNRVTLTPFSDFVTINGKSYQGDIVVERNKKNVTLGACVSQKILQDALVNKEWWANLPPPIKKVQKSRRQKKSKATLATPVSVAKKNVDKKIQESLSLLQVKVLLGESKNLRACRWHVRSDDGFIIADPSTPSKRLQSNKQDLFIKITDTAIYLNDKKFLKDSVVITPKKGYLAFEGRSYQGSFLVMRSQQKNFFINCLDLEDYIFSVLQTESWPGWPLEVNKVFAITSRSYVIAMITRAKKSKQPYHVCNTNLHQTYSGVHNNQMLRKAVEQTKGLFLTYDNKPALAMFDSCCGGIIPAHIVGIDFTKAPYLARDYACHYCKTCKIYSWQTHYEPLFLEHVLKQEYGSIKKLKDIKVTKRDQAGLVQELCVRTQSKRHKLTGKRLYSLLGKVKSFYFSVRKKAGKFLFEGRGYGHHVGLCQWGAREMVRHGKSHKHVLEFYYPGTRLMRLI